ncbi:BspA family leucine-rich repeat surface protein [archaeon]|nr:MAG: BspA family leucine-rich repeat surface protein [archaeon]
MLDGVMSFNQLIGQWNVSKVLNMSFMFCEAHSLNQPVTSWDVSKVRDMSSLYWTQQIGHWNVSHA